MRQVAILFARADSISVERLRELFLYDPDTGALTRKVAVGCARVGAAVGTPNCRGHMVVSVGRKLLYVHRIAWAIATGAWPQHEIDHRDGDSSNNRWENLRDVPHRVNIQNRRRPNEKDAGRRLLGVFAQGTKFTSKIGIDGAVRRLGTFDTAEEAHAAYVAAKRELHEGCTL